MRISFNYYTPVMEAELDKMIGCDIKRIPDVLKRLHAHKESLVDKLTGSSGAVMESSETAWYNALHKAKEVLDELNKLKQQCVNISLPSDSDTNSNRPMVLMTKYQCLVTEVKQLQNILSYISWLVRVQQTSSKIEIAIATTPLSKQAVDLYVELVAMASKLENSQCSNLKRYINETTDYWRQQLNDKLSSEFSSLMKLLKWPLTASSSDHVISVWESIQEKVTELVMLIIQMDQWDSPNRVTLKGKVPGLHDPVMLLVQLLVQPLRKRFLYHFTGSKKTNSPEKPEWYMSQVLAWIRDHSSFLEEKIQPLLEVAGVCVDVRAEFVRCLLQEVYDKLHHDMTSLSDNEVTVAHTIDELLSFERELRSSLCYHHPLPSCVGVLMEQQNFHKWITLERKFTIEKLTVIMESTTAWDLQYREVVDIDVSKVTICAEQLMSLMASITDRYKLLYSPSHQLDFVSLQLELLIAFHHDLTDASNRLIQPLSRQQAAYLNTALYIAMVMTEWGEQTFFLELHLCKEQLKELISSETQCYSELSPMVEELNTSTSQLTGTIFDDVVNMYNKLADSIEHCMASHILNNWRTKCAHYRNHKWQNLPSANDYISMQLSSVACDLLVSLRQQLQFLEANVCQAACKKIWPIILDGLDSLMISEVILMCHFNEGGGAQLQYDITRNLIPLLAQYSGLKSSQIMMRSREACKLLTAPLGSAKLLKQLLISVQHSRSDDNSYDNAVTSLATDIKIYNLTPNDAHQVLSKRLLPE